MHLAFTIEVYLELCFLNLPHLHMLIQEDVTQTLPPSPVPKGCQVDALKDAHDA